MNLDDQQAAIRDVLRNMMEATGLDPTGLARLAGVSPSTLTRFLNQPVKHLLTARTLAKLSQASGVPVPAGSPLIGPSERELLAAFRATDQQGRSMMLRLARSLRPESETGHPTTSEPVTVAPPRPKGPEPPHPPLGGRVEENQFRRGCAENVRELRAAE